MSGTFLSLTSMPIQHDHFSQWLSWLFFHLFLIYLIWLVFFHFDESNLQMVLYTKTSQIQWNFGKRSCYDMHYIHEDFFKKKWTSRYVFSTWVVGATNCELRKICFEVMWIYFLLLFVGISAAKGLLYLMVLKKVEWEARYTHLVKFMSMIMTKLWTAYMIGSAFSKGYVFCTSFPCEACSTHWIIETIPDLEPSKPRIGDPVEATNGQILF
jgi:hypothetical protein